MQKNIGKAIQDAVHEVFASVRDVRVVGAVVFLVVALMITWSGVHVIETNYKLQQEIARLEQENRIQKLKNQNMALENTYLESEEYLELEARKNLGLAAQGETVWVVPKDVAMRYTIPPAEDKEETAQSDEPSSNFEAWLDFLLNRR
jgi:cell division protein FtsL